MKKKLMFVIPTLIGGGAEKTVANLSQYLSEKYDVYIVLMKKCDNMYSHGGNVIFLKNYDTSNIFSKALLYFRQILELRKLKKKYNISCSISFLLQADLINVLSKRKEKVIVSIRNKDSVLWKNKIAKKLIRYTLKKCDNIVAISRQVKDDIVNSFRINKDKVITIYNPCIISEFGDSKKVDIRKKYKENIVINIGRLTEQKGQWHLIRAFKKVVREIPNAKLLVLGQGELYDYLLDLIDKMNLSSNIELLGFVNNPYDYLKNSDIFVFPSLYEGLGNSLLEAMACKVPIISSDCDCGPREILAPDTDYRKKVKEKYELAKYGVLTPVGDNEIYNYDNKLTKEEDILADAIVELLKDKDLRKKYKNEMSDRIKDFNIHEIIRQWEVVINDN